MDKKDFLLEIGCEELPTDHQQTSADHIAQHLSYNLDKAKITYGKTHTYSSPRRLAVLINDMATKQPSFEIEKQGPSYHNAYDKEGQPTLACLGFARSCGVSIDQLEVQEIAKERRVFCHIKQPGKLCIDLLPKLVENALKNLPSKKLMHWGDYDFTFIRPIQWIVMLFGKDIVPATLFGKKASRNTQGHRFLYPKQLSIDTPCHYKALLYSEAYVVADYKKRLDSIEKALYKAAIPPNKPLINPNLLNEVTALVEWPVALTAQFNEKFLKLPHPVLITSMATHLKCFPVEDNQGNLLSRFVLISNIKTSNPKLIIQGNERVINARLSDAEFFYKNDLKIPLKERLESLGHVVFQKQLGTMKDKSYRLSKLACFIAKHIGANETIAKHAALLSKCDLVSEMVIEFPQLQGIMGYYYAISDNESKACAIAIKEHYLPRFSGDSLPGSLEATSVALADRLDTLIGILGINKKTTGDKDPYGLRRSALAVLRILIEKKIDIDLIELIQQTIRGFEHALQNSNLIHQTFEFFMNRLKAWYQEQGISSSVFEAVLACQPTNILDFHRRIEAVQAFQNLPEGKALALANKRVGHILKKAGLTISKNPDTALLKQREEKILAKKIEQQRQVFDALYKKADYKQALNELASLKETIDAFFQQVMIMDENKEVRLNRLALLTSLHHLFSQIADISLLQ